MTLLNSEISHIRGPTYRGQPTDMFIPAFSNVQKNTQVMHLSPDL
jgi:hypothetical protein